MLIIVFETLAQQLPIDNQYLINRFSLSPAYTGLNQNTEAFAGYRQNWAGISGAPLLKGLTMSAPLSENMGIGGRVSHFQAGLFSNINASMSYGYHLNIDRKQSLSFGVSAGVLHVDIDRQSIKTPTMTDPVLLNISDMRATAFDVGWGVLYTMEKLHIGFAMPRLFATNARFGTNDANQYTPTRHYLAHVSMPVELNRGEYVVEPVIVARFNEVTPFLLEASVMINYKKMLWFAPTYRLNNSFAFSVGGQISDRLIANYSYEIGGTDIQTLAGASHEISIGYLFGSKSNRHFSAFRSLADSPTSIDGRLQKLEKDKCCENSERKIKKMEKQIKKLKSQLNTYVSDTSKIGGLRQEIRLLEAEIDDLKNREVGEIQFEKPFVLNNIHFATNSDNLKPTSYPALNKIVEQMNQKPNSTIKIVGHTDNVGNAVYNLKLSKRRAISLKKYLESKGVNGSRIYTDGKGMAQPISPNDSESGRAKNRRIEVSFNK